MDFLTEYNDVGSLPTKAAVAYMFLDLFKVQMKDSEKSKRGLHWCLKAVERWEQTESYRRHQHHGMVETKYCLSLECPAEALTS